MPCGPGLARCPRCPNFMNWERLWGDLWRCAGCGAIVWVEDGTGTPRPVEDVKRARGGAPLQPGGIPGWSRKDG